ncbi:hypothetical protein DWQ65_11095 [Treponema phagedenis]|nr:hypothetical protein C5O78_06325 [Treponema phagedenis]QSI00593.1 hypothetical protein DWQ65_11095 [Treponema phagedenis]
MRFALLLFYALPKRFLIDYFQLQQNNARFYITSRKGTGEGFTWLPFMLRITWPSPLSPRISLVAAQEFVRLCFAHRAQFLMYCRLRGVSLFLADNRPFSPCKALRFMLVILYGGF